MNQYKCYQCQHYGKIQHTCTQQKCDINEVLICDFKYRQKLKLKRDKENEPDSKTEYEYWWQKY